MMLHLIPLRNLGDDVYLGVPKANKCANLKAANFLRLLHFLKLVVLLQFGQS